MITQGRAARSSGVRGGELEGTGIALADNDRASIEVADFGLSRLREIGLHVLVYVNTDRYCAKELVLYRARRARSTAIRRSTARPGRRRRSGAGGGW